jgi:hypothetical protein
VRLGINPARKEAATKTISYKTPPDFLNSDQNLKNLARITAGKHGVRRSKAKAERKVRYHQYLWK